MSEQPEVLVTEQDRATARESVQKSSRGTTVGGIFMVGLTNLLAVVVAEALAPGEGGFGHAVIVAGVAIVFAGPLLWGVARLAKGQAIRDGSISAAHERQMATEARRREFETRLANALEMAEGEPEAHDAIRARADERRARRAGRAAARRQQPRAPRPHGRRRASRRRRAGMPGRLARALPRSTSRRRPQRFADSEALDACPKLRGRRAGSLLGRVRAGVDHGSDGRRHPHDRYARVRRLDDARDRRPGDAREPGRGPARHAAGDGGDAAPGVDRRPHRAHQPAHASRTRSASLRASQPDVRARDGRPRPLQGAQRHARPRGRRPRAADLRADAARARLRPGDVACRFGGEEFTLVLPDADTAGAVDAMERVR